MRDGLDDREQGWTSTHVVEAFNLSRQSENRIHDEATAKGLGFVGSLVPGVEIYAYACHPVGFFWGTEWLRRGNARCRFFKPVYDGHQALVSARATGVQTLSLSVASDGALCATMEAELGAASPCPPPPDYLKRAIPNQRPAADALSLAPGTWLGTPALTVTPALAESYLDAVRETDPLYRRERIIHPGQILRLCNQALIQNVILDVWIHTGSVVQNHDLAHVGDTLSVRAKVVANYEHRGHRMVDLDILVLADDSRPIAQVMHTAIYRLRQKPDA